MYDDNHRYFLQYILHNSYIPIETALNFCTSNSIEAVKDGKELKQFVAEINDKISKQDLKINFLKCEVTGDDKLVLLNTVNDDVSKLQNSFRPAELEYFQLVLQELVTADDHQINKMQCYNLNMTANRINADTIEKLLEKWTSQGYLVENGSSMCLGARCVAEFDPYFKVHCKDYYSDCLLCSETVFVGSTCDACQSIMHRHCIDRYLTKHDQCPSCKRTWNAQRMQAVNGTEESSSDESEIPTPRVSRTKRKRVL
ncbi:hypothetical protein PPYR_06918 [Photinus pyralis]|uniref:Non-structural maintenance of chromosomes element 1 homolog n=2 Tax=Photinus pyralis TaxID=7054 RepID=A0A1Y1MUU0_PHOPY|nr:non-structural maintenance of chromosomes element 1 homolog [Photinus pyralis]KAB0799038.1 hypothetical protein PPYR_06918 [Photinus pyralis]